MNPRKPSVIKKVTYNNNTPIPSLHVICFFLINNKAIYTAVIMKNAEFMNRVFSNTIGLIIAATPKTKVELATTLPKISPNASPVAPFKI